jgi:hypothetical protein
MQGSVRGTATGLLAAAALVVAPAAAHAAQQTSAVWRSVAKPAATGAVDVAPSHFRAFALDAAGMKAKLATAPAVGLHARAMAKGAGTVISLPAPNGGFQRFEVQESPVMEAGLAAKHPDIKTYAGRGLDDPDATIRADQTPLGFHASVRSPDGAWYIDPYYHLSSSVYVSYFGRDLANAHGAFREGEIDGDSDPFDIGAKAAADPTVTLRTYRLALLTDQSYATFFGGGANVTAAKVTLMNRVDQIYEDETAIRMILIANNDKLNLDTDAQAILPNGPCGGAACFTSQQLSTCGTGTLTRNHNVIGQIIGASNYDIGHIMLGKNGGGVAQLGVVGGSNKGRGCTGLPTPVGDLMAVDYVAHEMGHEFAGNHTFNGTQLNCSGGNRNANTSVEPGSGSSIMAYAGICQQDNLQPHSDPYWSQRSFDEITAYTSSDRAPINEIQTASLTGFDGTDSFLLGYQGKTANIVRGTNYSAADIQGALNGTEVQQVRLTGYDADGDAYSLGYKGATSVPIVRGQNNTAAGIANALQGGSEQQQAILTGFNAANQTFQIQVNGTNTPTFGQGGLAVSNANVVSAINAILGAAGSVTSAGAGNAGFTLTFGGGLANTDVPSIAIVNCTSTATATCAATVREVAKGGTALAGWPAGGTVSVGSLTDAGYTLAFGGAFGTTDVDPVSVANPNDAVAGTVTENEKGGTGILPAGATGTVAASGLSTAFDDTGFQVTFGGTLAGVNVDMLTIQPTGATGFISDTAQGGPINNKGFITTDTGNHAPVVTTAPAFTIPTRTPFSLTGSATDADSDPLTYMWEQNDVGVTTGTGGSTTGTALVNNTKRNGPLFRQFGTAAIVSAEDTLKTPSPGENHVDNNPTRVFPDMAQILIDNTNARTGACPTAPPSPQVVPAATVDCFSEFLPTADWVGALALPASDRTMTFRLTARDYRPGGGGIGSAQTKVTIAPLAGPFRVTSQAVPQVIFLGPPTNQQTVTWDVAGTSSAPVNVSQVKISLSTDGGKTFPIVLADATPNDGSETVTLPNTPGTGRIKVEAVGNVFFDVSHADLSLVTAPTSTVSGSVPAQLALSLGPAATFGPFTPGVSKDYDSSTTATVISTAGDAALAVSDPSTNNPGHLVNGTFFLPSALQAKANTGTLTNVGSAPATLLTYSAPVSNDQVTVGFRQHIGNTDALRTGTYSKTLTFTLSTTNP